MKTKNTIIGIVLASSMAFAAVLGVSSNKKAITAKATYSQGSVIASDKARIWIGYDTTKPFYQYADPSTSDANSSGLNGGIKLWIHSTETGGSEKVYNLTGNFNNSAQSGRRYSYADVDLSVYTNEWYMNVQKFQGGTWKCSTTSIQLKSSNAFNVYYCWDNWDWNKSDSGISAATIDSVDAGLVAKALGGMHTCSSSDINGYNAFPNFNLTFVKTDKGAWKTNGNLSDYTVDDFATGDTSYTGSATTTTNAYDKYVYVQEMYNTGGNPSFAVRMDLTASTGYSATFAIAVVSAITVALGGTYFLLKKKKSN